MMEPYLYWTIGLLVLVIYGSLMRTYLSPWLRCQLNGCPATLRDLTYIIRKGAKTGPVCDAYIVIRKMGIPITIPELTALYLASPNTFIEEVKQLIVRLQPKTQAHTGS